MTALTVLQGGHIYHVGNCVFPATPLASVSVLATSTLIAAADATRVYGMLANDSDTDIWLNLGGGAAVVGKGISLPVGKAFEFGNAFGNNTVKAIYAIAEAAGGKNLTPCFGAGV